MGKTGRPYKYSTPTGDIDIDRIQALTDAYFDTHTVYSIPGLCLALDITRETLSYWGEGYTQRDSRIKEDQEEEAYNYTLATTIKKALLHIEQYLIESDDTKRGLKHMAALNASFGYRKQEELHINAKIEMDLGNVGKFAK